MGSGTKGRRARLLAVAAGCTLVVVLVCASVLGSDRALGQSISLLPNPLEVHFKGWTSPAKLSGKTPTPVKLNLEGSISTSDGSRIPTLETLSLQFDKNGAIFTKGLPTCSISELTSTVELTTKPVCQNALVGHGNVGIQIDLPEGGIESTSGPLVIFNGRPQDGHPDFIYRLYAHVPAPTDIFTSGEILNERGKFGTQTSIKIPKIVSGYGSLTSFKAVLGRTWTYRGKEVSLLTASCPNGRLEAKSEFAFVGGVKFTGEIERKKCS